MTPRKILLVATASVVVGCGGAVAGASGGAESSAVSVRGTPVTASAGLLGALSIDDLAAYRPDAATAQRIDAAGESWTVVRGGSGALCVDVGQLTVTCASADEIAGGRLGVTTVAPPSAQVEERLAAARRAAVDAGRASSSTGPVARGAALRRGIVADGTTEVRAVDSDGHVIAAVPVRGNTYRLDLGAEGDAAALVLVTDRGSTTAPLR